MVVPRSRVNEMVDVHSTGIQRERGDADQELRARGGRESARLYVLRDGLRDEVWEQRMHEAMEKIYQKARELGGQVSGEHGIGFAKKPYLKESLPEASLRLMNGIKKVFDPENILNPREISEE